MARRISLRTIVIGGVVAGLLIPMSIGTIYSLSLQRENLTAQAKAAHTRATNITSLGVTKAFWDLSPEAATPLVKSVMDDTRVVQVKIVDPQNQVFLEEKDDSRRHGTVVSQEQPVLNGEEVIGKVIIDFSMADAEEQISERMFEAILLSGIQALACIAILILLINRRLLARFTKIKDQAEQLAAKSLDQPFIWPVSDEIGELGSALETTRKSLKDLFSEIEAKNADLASMNDNLEKIVAERTATIKMILDHVKSGFLLVDKNLVIDGGYTRSCETLLGATDLQGKTLVQALHLAGGKAEHFVGCAEQVFDDIFPEEISLDQMPRRFHIGERSVSVEGSTIRDASGAIAKILFTIVDVTALEQVERENRQNRAMVRIMQSIAAFRDFITESKGRIASSLTALSGGNEPLVRRELHTLKGNSAAFGLDEIATFIHHVEDQSAISLEHINAIENNYKNFLDEKYELLKLRFGEEVERSFIISPNEAGKLASSVAAARTIEAAREAVGAWVKEIQTIPAIDLLGPMESYVLKLAADRGKELQFKVIGGTTKIDPEETKDIIQNLIHLVRNSVDHGIETPDERCDRDKAATAEVSLSFKEENNVLTIEVRDDGRGINANSVKEKAVTMGKVTAEAAAKMSQQEILRLIFLDGLSTAESVSSTSGRGVGMKAILDAVESRGGSVLIETKEGVGTTFSLRVPVIKNQGAKVIELTSSPNPLARIDRGAS